MSMKLARRQVLATAGAIAAFPAAPARAAAGTLTVVRRNLEVNGKAASVFGIVGANGAPGVVLAPGERFRVDLRNRGGARTIVHWHGQTPPVRQDGVTQTRLESLIGDGADQGYDYAPRAGTHWMHSHHGLQEQQLMAAPMIVLTGQDRRRDAQDMTVLLHDFTFRDPTEILAGLTQKPAGEMASMKGMTDMSGGAMPAGAAMDLNDIDFDAYLANDRTLADPQVVRAERGGQVLLRLINGATSTAFWIDLGALTGHVIAVDGDPVHPIQVRRFPMAEAQRVDLLLRLPQAGGAFSVLAQREGDRQRTGIILATPGAAVRKLASEAPTPVGPADLSLERRLTALLPPLPRRIDRVHRVELTGSMAPYAWGIDGRAWPNHKPLKVAQGERVALDLVNRTDMAHPMHLHGHHFQVLALNGSQLRGAMRDTVLVPPKGTARIAFDADNPGRWLFHCHNLYHMAVGMMTEIAYAGQQF